MDVEHRDVIFCSTGQLLCLAGVGGSTPTVEYRSRQPFDGEAMPRKRPEGRSSV
ncbi:TPA: hypothetical protein R1887_005233 [Klebsiella oxytoca]|nr:hypothetical protein [Klebsiella oxytoca]